MNPKARCVYEVRVTGFDLRRSSRRSASTASSARSRKMIEPAADRRKRKNDRNDAGSGQAPVRRQRHPKVWVPDNGVRGGARPGARAGGRALARRSRDPKQMLSKFLLGGTGWSSTRPIRRAREEELDRCPTGRGSKSVSFAERADNEVLAYIDRVNQATEDKARLERLVAAEASKPRWKKAGGLRPLPEGIDVMTAADLVFEAGEFSRFKSARSFAAWIGLTPSEHSSGEGVHRGGITKAGNRHLRKDLVESAWHYLSCSPHSKDLARGQVPDPRARRHAAKGVRRLVARREDMLARGLNKNKANVATARELACWVWAVGRMAESA